MKGRLRTWHRRAFAATAALLWLLGGEVLPNLHLATHHHDHTHGADGSIVLLGHGPEDREPSHAHRHGHGQGHEHASARDAHEHREHVECAELAALGIAHEHIVIADEVALFADEHVDLAHGHGDAVHEHVDDEAPEVAELDERAPRRHPRGDGQLAIDDRVPPGHAALGIAHHAMALHQPPPPQLAPLAAPAAETWTYAAPNQRADSAWRARPTARGPPVS